MPAFRAEALRRLHKKLVARRDELLRTVRDNMADLSANTETGDDADTAVVAIKNEILAQLAEMEERELLQINHALVRMKKGSYGHCESCNAKIPVGRLDALPYATLCIDCQRAMELDPERREVFESNVRQSLEYANGVGA